MRKTLLLLALSMCFPMFLSATDWPNWRGPDFKGVSPDKGYPVKWSTTENVVWVAPMPGRSGGTPVVANKKVFVTASDNRTYELTALCLNRDNGEVLWKKKAGEGFSPSSHRGNPASSASPVADGKHVYFLFGTGRIIACDLNGNTLWDRDLAKDHGRFWVKFGYSSSPLLHKGRLYIQVLHGFVPAGTAVPESYLLCLDAATGKDKWKQVRKTSAKHESPDAYNTPYLFKARGGWQIIINGGDHVTGHDPKTGSEIWRSDNYNKRSNRMYRTICGVTSWKNILIAPEARGNSLFAFPDNASGQLKIEDRLWTIPRDAPDVCVPLVYGNRLFVLDGKRKVIICRDPKTGKELGRYDMPGSSYYYASPTCGGGKIYNINLDGMVVVLSADKELKELAVIDMKDSAYGSSISLSDGQLFIRTDNKLFCVGK